MPGKAELIAYVAKRKGHHPMIVKSIVDGVFECVTDMLVRGRFVDFREFGQFRIVHSAARTGRNLRGPNVVGVEPIAIPERVRVRFKAGKGLKLKISQAVKPCRAAG